MNIVQINDTMSSIEISELTGKPHNELMKAIRKMEIAWTGIGQGGFAQSSYVNSQNRQMPMYILSKTECLYIATKFNDTARAKLVLRWEQLEKERLTPNPKPLTPAERNLYQAQVALAHEQKLAEHDNRLAELEAKTTTRPDYYTIAGYGTINGQAVNYAQAKVLGRKAAKLCKEQGLPKENVRDVRFGYVGSYPASILKEVFNSYFNQEI